MPARERGRRLAPDSRRAARVLHVVCARLGRRRGDDDVRYRHRRAVGPGPDVSNPAERNGRLGQAHVIPPVDDVRDDGRVRAQVRLTAPAEHRHMPALRLNRKRDVLVAALEDGGAPVLRRGQRRPSDAGAVRIRASRGVNADLPEHHMLGVRVESEKLVRVQPALERDRPRGIHAYPLICAAPRRGAAAVRRPQEVRPGVRRQAPDVARLDGRRNVAERGPARGVARLESGIREHVRGGGGRDEHEVAADAVAPAARRGSDAEVILRRGAEPRQGDGVPGLRRRVGDGGGVGRRLPVFDDGRGGHRRAEADCRARLPALHRWQSAESNRLHGGRAGGRLLEYGCGQVVDLGRSADILRSARVLVRHVIKREARAAARTDSEIVLLPGRHRNLAREPDRHHPVVVLPHPLERPDLSHAHPVRAGGAEDADFISPVRARRQEMRPDDARAARGERLAGHGGDKVVGDLRVRR